MLYEDGDGEDMDSQEVQMCLVSPSTVSDDKQSLLRTLAKEWAATSSIATTTSARSDDDLWF